MVERTLKEVHLEFDQDLNEEEMKSEEEENESE